MNCRWILCSHHKPSLLEINSGPLSTLMRSGLPLHWMVCSRARITLSARREVSTSIVKASRLKSSSKLSTLNLRPDKRESLMKSIDQLALMRLTASSGWSMRAGNLLFPFRFMFSFNNLYTLCIRLWFHGNPSFRILKYIFQKPSVGRFLQNLEVCQSPRDHFFILIVVNRA